jgi:hypothetical protein
MEILHTETRKGYTINIYPDYDYNYTPDKWGNEGVLLVAYHRDFTVEADKIITKNEAMAIARNEYDDKDQKDACKATQKKIPHVWLRGVYTQWCEIVTIL